MTPKSPQVPRPWCQMYSTYLSCWTSWTNSSWSEACLGIVETAETAGRLWPHSLKITKTEIWDLCSRETCCHFVSKIDYMSPCYKIVDKIYILMRFNECFHVFTFLCLLCVFMLGWLFPTREGRVGLFISFLFFHTAVSCLIYPSNICLWEWIMAIFCQDKLFESSSGAGWLS